MFVVEWFSLYIFDMVSGAAVSRLGFISNKIPKILISSEIWVMGLISVLA